jgi:AraC family transcriptional regulator
MTPEHPGFSDVFESHSQSMTVVVGRLKPGTRPERTLTEIEIALPGDRALAEIAYWNAQGVRQHRSVIDRHVSIIPAGQTHQIKWQRPAEVTVFLLLPTFVQEIAHKSKIGQVEIAEEYCAIDPLIWHLGRAVRTELRRSGRLDEAYTESVATVLAQHLLTTYASSPGSAPPNNGLTRYKLRQATDYIHDNCGKDISFHDVAAHLKMSAYHFARMFKYSTGDPPHQYIVRCRMNRAKKLLAETNLPITDIAFEVGYGSQSHFTTRFRRFVGATPAAFRAEK